MSDAGNVPPPREWRFYLDDMIGFAERVLTYTDGLDQAAFDTAAKNAKEGCPISKLLKAEITMDAKLEA